MKKMRLMLIGAMLWLPALVSGMTADELSKETGVAGGLCSFPRFQAADQSLVLELARRPSFVVHVMSTDDAALTSVRQAADKEGLMGRSLYVERGSAAALPFADRLVDLLVVTDLTGRDLTPELKAEWLRVLGPRRGAALVGGTVLRSELPAGSDAWTHRCHDAGNAQVSTDSTFKPPFLTQWWGLPRQEGFWGTTAVSGNGRLFTIRASRRPSDPVLLSARSLNNGIVLWQQLLRPAATNEKVAHGGYISGRACAVVAGDTLLLIDRDGLAALDAETGNARSRIAGPKPGGQIKWMGLQSNVLVVLAGEADIIQPITYQTVAANPHGRNLAAYEWPSSRELWRQELAGDVDERLIVTRDSGLYCLSKDVGMLGMELRTGKCLWTNSTEELLADFAVPPSKALGAFLFSQPGMMAVDDTLVLRARWAKSTTVLSRADGKTLWRLPYGGGYRGIQLVALNGQLLGCARTPLDLKTGVATNGPRFASSGCGPTTAVPGYLITCFGAVHDIQSGRAIRGADIKSPCDVGSLVSEGVMVTLPSECGCAFEMKGYRALVSAGVSAPQTNAASTNRLTVFDRAEPAAMTLTDADWPTYRHDPGRSAASSAMVGEGLKVLWHWKPSGAIAYSNVLAATVGPRLSPDFVSTAPVAAAGFAWWASPDGVIRCVAADTGREVWTFATGGMMFSPPTVWQGRLLAGGSDGRVTCLDASTGRLLWQRMVGPAARRVFWFGHLVGTWPMLSGVAVQDGRAYAVAGYQKDNGTYACAFNPVNGEAFWEKTDVVTDGGKPVSMPGGGAAALDGDRMWIVSTPSGYFDLQSGESKTTAGSFGCEVGVFDKWVIQGGRRLSETQDTRSQPLGASGFGASSTNQPPKRVALTNVGTSLPAWDAELVLMPPMGTAGVMSAVPATNLLTWLEERPAALAAFQAAKQAAKLQTNAPKPEVVVEWLDLKTWATEPMVPAAFALAGNQAVVAHSDGKKHGVAGFRRADGTKAWSLDLPEQPAMNRLAVDRDGRVMISLCDGSVVCVGR